MSGPDRNTGSERERIEAELAALGEEPLADDPEATEVTEVTEVAFALDGARDLDIATVQTLAGWAEAPDGSADQELSELAQARVWRTIELRTKSDATRPETSGVSGGTGTTPLSSRRLPGPLLAVVAVVAVAAAVVLVPRLTPPPAANDTQPLAKAPPSVPTASTLTAEELEFLSMQARAGLDALDRLSDQPRGTARVEEMAADYARRLQTHGSQG